MLLHEKIKEEIKQAMLNRETIKLEVLRFLSAALTNEVIAQKKKPQEMLADDQVLTVIRRLVKQRKDSIEQFQKAGRAELVKEEEEQMAILETYLPIQMSRAEVEIIAKRKQEELGIIDKTKMGLLMSNLMKELKDKADGSLVKEVVESLF